jgi:hypothetical protein
MTLDYVSGTFSGNGTSTPLLNAGTYGFVAAGTFGSGSLKVTLIDKESVLNGTPAKEFDSFGTTTTITANGEFTIKVPQGLTAKIVLSGATSPSLNWHIGKIAP